MQKMCSNPLTVRLSEKVLRNFLSNTPQTFIHKVIQPFFCTASKKHLPISTIDKKDCLITRLLATDTFHLILAASTKEIEADTILLRFNHLSQPRSQSSIFSIRQAALKHTILHPLPVGLQDIVDFSPAFVFRDIVRNYYVWHLNLE